MDPYRWTTATPARLAWTVCALSLAALAVAAGHIGLGWSRPAPEGFVPWAGQLVAVVGATGAVLLGGLLAARRPQNWYGWLWSAFAASFATHLTAGAYLTYSAVQPDGAPGTDVVAVAGDAAWTVWITLMPLLLLLFPTGRVPSSRWRWLALAIVGLGAVLLVVGQLIPRIGIAPIDNPLGVDGAVGTAAATVVDVGVLLLFVSIVLSAFSLVFRYRTGTGTRRQQIKWFAFAGILVGLFVVTDPFFELPGAWDAVLETATFCIMYVGVGVAVLRHGLYDIDLVINRTLVYGLLTTGIVAVYVLVVGYLSSLFRAEGNLVISLVVTGLVAALFAPAREVVQRGVNRLMYGERDDPYAAVSRLGRRLEASLHPTAVLPAVVEAISRALRSPRVELWLLDDGGLRLAARHGEGFEPARVPDVQSLEALCSTAFVTPLTSAGQVVGALTMAPRGEGQDFSEADRRLVRDLAAQAGAAVHAVRLGEALVGATEGERRRIQRDLHDGLGPVLASIRLRVEACLEAVPDSPIVPDLERLHALVGEATADIRRLVHDLYPPVLDQRGLVEALEQHCDRFGLETRLEVSLETDTYRPLAAVHELGLLRIAQEALVNVAKHAQASAVRVHLEQHGGDLELRVSDDGVGWSDRPPGEGAGIGSMRARAEQLGGTLQIEGSPGTGTEVVVRVPMAA